MHHVLIADDHEVTRRGVRDLLTDSFEDIETVEVSNADGILPILPSRAWDLILLDIMMPGTNVFDVIVKIREITTTVPILILTAAPEVEYVTRALSAGANGVVHKHRASDELIKAFKTVAGGGIYLHPETAVEVARSLRESRSALPHERLSSRESQIFRAIAAGKAIKEIAAHLALSEKTIATYLARIREKTGLVTYVDIARYAIQNRLVD